MSPQPKRILILFAHPAPNLSEVNLPLARAAADRPGVTLVDLYAEYPSLEINVAREQQRLLDHDVIVFMHPLYWYSTPAILKEWQDLVLEYNFAYGHNGLALKGKWFFNAISAGGGADAYRPGGYNRYPLRELLRPFEMTATLCHMQFLPPLVIFSARKAQDEGRVDHHKTLLLRTLDALVQDEVPYEAVKDLATFNEFFQAEAHS